MTASHLASLSRRQDVKVSFLVFVHQLLTCQFLRASRKLFPWVHVVANVYFRDISESRVSLNGLLNEKILMT